MTKDQKNEVIELLKGKFSQYNNFYVTNTESLLWNRLANCAGSALIRKWK